MNYTLKIVSSLIVIFLFIIGYFSGHTLGYQQGIISGSKEGIKSARAQELKDLNKRLGERELKIFSMNLDNSTLIFILEFMRVSDDSSNRVRIRKTNPQGYIVYDHDGLIVREVHRSGRISIRGKYNYTIYELKNATDQTILIDNTYFDNLPMDFDVNNQIFQQDPIQVLSSN
jgi:hypothetical protein